MHQDQVTIPGASNVDFFGRWTSNMLPWITGCYRYAVCIPKVDENELFVSQYQLDSLMSRTNWALSPRHRDASLWGERGETNGRMPRCSTCEFTMLQNRYRSWNVVAATASSFSRELVERMLSWTDPQPLLLDAHQTWLISYFFAGL